MTANDLNMMQSLISAANFEHKQLLVAWSDDWGWRGDSVEKFLFEAQLHAAFAKLSTLKTHYQQMQGK